MTTNDTMRDEDPIAAQYADAIRESIALADQTQPARKDAMLLLTPAELAAARELSQGWVDMLTRELFRRGAMPVRYHCPDCGYISYHPEDAANKFCGYCHKFGE